MALKIGGELGKIANRAKKNTTNIFSNPVKGIPQSIFDDPLVSGITRTFEGAGLGGGGENVAQDYLDKQAAIKATKNKAENDPTKGFSQFNDLKQQYLAKFGPGRVGGENMLSDLTSNAYAPITQGYQDFNSQAPVSANIDPAFRNYQMQLAQQLQAQAAGQGPSLAQMQLQQATNQSMNNSLGLIRASTGANGALGARTAALAGAQQLGNYGLQSGVVRLQEQMAAQNALAGLYNQGRAGDQEAAGLQADVALKNRNQQLSGLEGQQNAIAAQTSGSTQVLQNALGIDAAAQEAKRQEAAARAQDRRNKENAAAGAVFSGLATAFGA